MSADDQADGRVVAQDMNIYAVHLGSGDAEEELHAGVVQAVDDHVGQVSRGQSV